MSDYTMHWGIEHRPSVWTLTLETLLMNCLLDGEAYGWTYRKQMERIVLIMLLIGGAACPLWSQDTGSGEVAELNITLNGPLLVGFLPTSIEAALDDFPLPPNDASQAVDHVLFALGDALRCLTASGLSATGRVDFTSTIVVTDGGTATRIELPTAWPRYVGIYLFLPGKKGLPVFAEDGRVRWVE